MRITRRVWSADRGWSVDEAIGEAPTQPSNTLGLVFGGRAALEDPRAWRDIQDQAAANTLIGCSTGGEIAGEEVLDDSITLTTVTFANATIRSALVRLDDIKDDSWEAGARLATAINGSGLKLAFTLSDGTRVNGSRLVAGFRSVLGDAIPLTGGLAGDGAAFQRTLVGIDDLAPTPGLVVAIGLFGDDLTIGHGTFGGWDRFGPERRVTRSSDNVLYELDGEPALALYKRYLGDEAAGLPGSALLFPLAIRATADDPEIVRTIVGVDEDAGTMTFAGDIPEGATAQLMRGHFDHLIEGAETAASRAAGREDGANDDVEEDGTARLAILISCIGRKLLLGQRTADEVEAASGALGSATALTGFYSYGELSPLVPGEGCLLHNQTMTVTTIKER